MIRGRVFIGLVRFIARVIKSLIWSGWYFFMYNYLLFFNIFYDMLNKVLVFIFIRRIVYICLLFLVLLFKGLEEEIIILFL